MPTTTFHPGPSQRNGPSAIGDGHQQQLMSKANLAAIHDQTDFSIRQPLEDGSGDWLIPFAYTDGRIIQQASDTAGQTRQIGRTRDLLGNFAQVDRTTFVQPTQQPAEIADPGDPFIWTKVSQHLTTSMVQFWYRHGSPRKLVSGNPSLLEGHADFYSFVNTVR